MSLDDVTVVLIGCGQMGSAIVRGLVASGALAPARLVCVDVDEAKQAELAGELGARAGEDALGEEDARRLFLIAVKPGYVRDVLEQRDFTTSDTVVSVAAGVTAASLRGWAGYDPAVVRSMPNTPCLVGQGVTGIFSADNDADALALATALFEAVGAVVTLRKEPDFDPLTAISGSGPAYVFTILEALADGGVLMGLDRATSRALAVETLAGAAALARASEEHTAELKDRVASPGGTTIAALRELERGNLRHTLISAVEAAARRSREMG